MPALANQLRAAPANQIGCFARRGGTALVIQTSL